MATTADLLFELQRRVILFRPGTIMPDGSTLGFDGDPNDAELGSSDGEDLLLNCPIGTRYQENNGNQWYKKTSPNNWERFESEIKENISAGNISLSGNTISTTTNELILSPQNGKISIKNNNIKKNIYLLRGVTTNSSQKSLTLDGNEPNQNNVLIFNNNKTIWNYDIKVSAYSDTTDEGCIFNIRGAAQKTILTASILPENILEEWKSSSMENCLVSVEVNNLSSNFYLNIGVTGINDMDIQWSAIAEISELIFNQNLPQPGGDGITGSVFYSNEVQII